MRHTIVLGVICNMQCTMLLVGYNEKHKAVKYYMWCIRAV